MCQSIDLFAGKTCRECHKFKQYPFMVRSSAYPDGYAAICKQCKTAYNKRFYAIPENIEKRKIHRQTNKLAKARGLHNAAKRRNRPTFSLTLERIHKALEKGVCERTGIPFAFEHANGTRHYYGPSVDRINSQFDYTDENVQIVCWAYNVGKAEMSDEQYQEYILIAADRFRK